MNTELSTIPPQEAPALFKPAKASALVVMASRLSVDPEKMLATLKSTVFKGATNEELTALVVVANEYGLNPFLKELYAFPAKGGGIVPVVSVDGWIKMLNRQKAFDGIDFEMVDGDKGKPYSCTAVIYIKERSRPVRVTEYFDECSRNTDPWNKSPRRMLRHKALIQGARVAFGFSGVYDEDEGRASGEIDERRLESAKPVFSTAPTLPAPAVEQNPEAMTPTPEPVTNALTTDQAASPLVQVGRLMNEAQISEDELTAWAIGKKLLAKDMELPQMTDKRLLDVVASWEKVKAEIIVARGGAH